ncbi:MAG: hypothetical protein H0S79_02160 [Anaerolineaceae bacterium]|nr:hypothetical protein [Anaerolineaceae bacterium]
MAQNLDLSTLFSSVTQALTQKQESLNEADTYNHDHGDHMVQIFDLIQTAVAKKSDEPVADQLAYASKQVEKKAESGSGKLYAEGLANAAKSFVGNELTPDTIGVLVNSLLSVEKPEAKQSTGNDLLGGLLSSLTGGGSSEEDQGLDVNNLLRAGMAFFQSKQDGDSNMEAAMDALLAASPMGQTASRSQSGSVVASTLLSVAQSFINK